MPNGLAIPGTPAFPILAPNGSVGAPSYSFASFTGSGLWCDGSIGQLRYSVNGTQVFVMATTGVGILADGIPFYMGASADVLLYRDAANVLAQRNGANAQAFRVYGTSVGSKYASVSHNGTNGFFSSSGILYLTCDAGGITLAGGFASLLWQTNNTYDIGATGAMPRTLYLGTSAVIQDDAGVLTFGASSDLQLARLAAASLRQGLAPSATPVAQTFTVGEASRPGTDTNVGGASGTIRSGLGTGTGTASSLLFQTPDLVASGSTTQTYTTRLTVATAAVTATVPYLAPGGSTGAPAYSFSGASSYGIYLSFPNVIISVSGADVFGCGSNTATLVASAKLGWSSDGGAATAQDLALARLAAASLRVGLAPSASPVAQTLTIGEFSRVGTDNNVAGSNGTIRPGTGTGNAAGASLIFQTPTAVGSGTVQQSYATRLTLSEAGAVFDIVNQGLRINGQTNAAGASVGTLNNSPAAGNPTFWLPINIAGSILAIPCF